ncbi:MAG: hypothetical protein JNN03_13945 [Rubrivivax sp.]|nr:hypothetical protein [Rubrivivax sp.]
MTDSFAPTVADASLLAASNPSAEDERIDPSPTSSAPAPGRPGDRQWLRDLLLVVALAGLVMLAWQIGEEGWVRPQERLGYWVGVAGASMMLLLFLYPLRKYAGWMRRLGKVKGWFWFHLLMGVFGPWLILVHAAFRTGSLNATVALYSMAIVVGSGVVGRFLYVRLNSHVEDAVAALHAVQRRGRLAAERGEGSEGAGPSALHYAPAVEQRLRAFEARELGGEPRRLRDLRQVLLLPLQRRFALWRGLRDLRAPLAARAAAGRWSADELARRRRRAERLVDDHLQAVVQVARRQAFGRVFALWHIAHLPFIYLLVISTVVHVIAVHAY